MIEDEYEEDEGTTAMACADGVDWAVYHCNGHCNDPDDECEHCGCCGCTSCFYARVA